MKSDRTARKPLTQTHPIKGIDLTVEGHGSFDEVCCLDLDDYMADTFFLFALITCQISADGNKHEVLRKRQV